MENENTNPAEEKDKKPEQELPPESAENGAEDAPKQTGLCEKISVKTKTVIKTILPERL